MADAHTEQIRDAWSANLVAVVAEAHGLWAQLDRLPDDADAVAADMRNRAERLRRRLQALDGHVAHAVGLAELDAAHPGLSG